MSSPLIVPLRDIPKTEMHIPSNDEEEIESSGFPFDDQDFDRGRSHHSSFRSQLDDLARRHPEFAQHLNIGDDFPLRAHTLGRHRRGSDTEKPSGSQDAEFGRRHAYDRPFPRFEHFDSPFRKYFEQDTPDFYDLPHHHQVRHGYPDDLSEEPRQHPQQHHHHTQQQEQKSQPSSPQPSNADKPPQVPQNREGGRKQNIQQSNTVDLGQKQQPVDENRGQRSMSAPPENRSTGQRFVTSINIPIQRTGGATGGGDMGNKAATQAQDHSSQQQQQQQHSSKPNERVIPIHVEGRDEPIIPKNATFSQAPPPQPQTERLFGKNPGHFTQFLNKGEPHGMNPEDYYRQQQQQFQKQQQEFHPQHFPQQQQSQSQTQAPPPPPSAPQSTSQQAQPEQQAQAPPPPPQPIKLTQLDQIQSIQKDVSELMNQVEIFNGKPKDKQYLYLDEMLTRNLIKLDNIETEGKDNIRQARKEAIKCIEGCIGILEAKANANLAAEIQKQQGSADQKMEVVATAEVGESKENAQQQQQVESLPSTATTNEDSKSSTVAAEQPKDATETTASLEVSGVSRTGSVVNVTPMEVNESESKKEVPVPTPNIETQAEENKKEQSALPTDPQQKPEENKDAEDVKKAEDANKTEGAAAAPENVGVSTGTTENTTAEAAASQSTEKDTASGEDKKEKKKGKKKEKSDNKK